MKLILVWGGKPNFKTIFHGRATPLVGMQINIPSFRDLTFKIENKVEIEKFLNSFGSNNPIGQENKKEIYGSSQGL